MESQIFYSFRLRICHIIEKRSVNINTKIANTPIQTYRINNLKICRVAFTDFLRV